jgi:hypothetical protein
MKVYFTGSLHNVAVTKKFYASIVETIQSMGHVVVAPILDTSTAKLDSLTPKDRVKHYRKLQKIISSVDIVVGEVSYPSTINIGHEVTLALDKGKPTIGLYQKGREPGLLQGIDSDKFVLLEYGNGDLKQVLEYGLEEAQEQMDVRFNFFVSPQIGNYLDDIAKKKRVPRAVYLRRLIEADMKKHPEFEG